MTPIVAALFFAQLLPGNSAGVAMGHLHLNVSDPAATRRFWVDVMGAAPYKLATIEGVCMPGAVILFKPGNPTGPTVGSVINHVGVTVNSLKAFSDKLTAAGFKVEPGTNPKQAMVNSPDGVRVEMTEDLEAKVPLANHHIHWNTPDAKEIQSWYAANFGAIPGMRGKFVAADLPGVNLSFTPVAPLPAPTKGRALDHIGFEVKNLAAFCKALEAKGVKFDVPYRAVPQLGISIAFLTDPWGTYIELTEGLAKPAAGSNE
jgi:catechol 2,3-dioxygenase-like lactoylglutathione lyase family enzyme